MGGMVGGDAGGGFDDSDAGGGGDGGGFDTSAGFSGFDDSSGSGFAGGDFGLDGGSFMPMLAAADGVSPLSGGNLMGSGATPVQTSPFGGSSTNPGNQNPLAQAASASPMQQAFSPQPIAQQQTLPGMPPQPAPQPPASIPSLTPAVQNNQIPGPGPQSNWTTPTPQQMQDLQGMASNGPMSNQTLGQGMQSLSPQDQQQLSGLQDRVIQPGSTQGNQYIQQQRAGIAQELQDPTTRNNFKAMLQTEGGGVKTAESAMNRINYFQSVGKTSRSSVMGELQSGFYGPENRGAYPAAIRQINANPALSQKLDGYINTALGGSDQIKGFTDQGLPTDPNGRYIMAHDHMSQGGNIYGDWAAGATSKWRQNFESQANAHQMSSGMSDGGSPLPPANVGGGDSGPSQGTMNALTQGVHQGQQEASTDAQTPAASNPAPSVESSPAASQGQYGALPPGVPQTGAGSARNPLPGLTSADYGTGRQPQQQAQQQGNAAIQAMQRYGANPTPANATHLFQAGMKNMGQGRGLIPNLLGMNQQGQIGANPHGFLGLLASLFTGGQHPYQQSQQQAPMGESLANPYMGGAADPTRNMTGSASNSGASGPQPARLQAANAWGGGSQQAAPQQQPQSPAMSIIRQAQQASQANPVQTTSYGPQDYQDATQGLAAQGSQILNSGNMTPQFDPMSPQTQGAPSSFGLPQGSPAASVITQAQQASAPPPAPPSPQDTGDQDASQVSDKQADQWANANGVDTNPPAPQAAADALPQKQGTVPAAQAAQNIATAPTQKAAVAAGAQSDHPVHQAMALASDPTTAVQAAPKVQVPTAPGQTNSTLQALPTNFNKPGDNTPTYNKLNPQQQSDALAMAAYTMKPLPGTAQKAYPGGMEGYRNVVAAARELNPNFDENNFTAAKDFKGDGKYATNMGVVRTASEHLLQLSNDYDNLQKQLGPLSNYPSWTAVQQAFSSKLNSNPQLAQSFARVSADNTAVGTEMAKAWRGVGSMSHEEQQEWQRNGSMLQSPASFAGGLSAMGGLLQGRYNTMDQQYQSVYHRPYGTVANGDMDMTPFHQAVTVTNQRADQYLKQAQDTQQNPGIWGQAKDIGQGILNGPSAAVGGAANLGAEGINYLGSKMGFNPGLATNHGPQFPAKTPAGQTAQNIAAGVAGAGMMGVPAGTGGAAAMGLRALPAGMAGNIARAGAPAGAAVGNAVKAGAGALGSAAKGIAGGTGAVLKSGAGKAAAGAAGAGAGYAAWKKYLGL